MRAVYAKNALGDIAPHEWRPLLLAARRPRVATPLARPALVAVGCYRRAADSQGHDEERQPGRILVVAGDAGRRMALFRLLERKGLRATVVNDGHEALAMPRTEPFDLVLIDSSRLLNPTASSSRSGPTRSRAAFRYSSSTNPPTMTSLARGLRQLMMNDAYVSAGRGGPSSARASAARPSTPSFSYTAWSWFSTVR